MTCQLERHQTIQTLRQLTATVSSYSDARHRAMRETWRANQLRQRCVILACIIVISLFLLDREHSPESADSPTSFHVKQLTMSSLKRPNELKLLMEWQRSHKLNGLGNQLFFYASQLGIAAANRLTPVVPEYHYLRKFLASPPEFIVNGSLYDQLARNAYSYPDERITQHVCCIYFSFTQRIAEFARSDILLKGAFQSWKYFHPEHEQLIKERLKINKEVSEAARRALSDAVHERSDQEKRLLIGVHVRRGDILRPHQRHFGHVAPPDSYYRTAMANMRDRHKNPLFIVVSNDLPWSYAAMKADDVVFIENQKRPEVDFAILTLMDHLIISVGTFSWWAAYLGRAGEVVYFNRTPAAGSFFDVTFREEDFWLPQWTGMN